MTRQAVMLIAGIAVTALIVILGNRDLAALVFATTVAAVMIDSQSRRRGA